MDIFLNFGLAWISVLLAIFLAIAYLTRKAIIRIPSKRKFFVKLNKNLRKHHKIVGAVLILTGLIHGLFSTDKLFSINWGTALWIVSILLGISWMLRKKLTGSKNWMQFHRGLVAVFIISILIHVVDAGGIQIFNAVKAANALSKIDVSEVYQMNGTNTPVPSVTPVPSSTDSPSETPVPSNSTEPSATASPAMTPAPSSAEPSPSSTPTPTPTPSTPAPTILVPEGNVYKDGTFTGEATGYQPGLMVSITIKDNEILSVEVTDHNELNSRFWSVPVYYYPIWIVQEQTTEIDTITGATFTSVGILNAVNDALRKALVSGEVPSDLPLPAGRRR